MGGSGHCTQYPSIPRTACEQQAVAFTLQEDGASLTVSQGPLALDLNLSKVPGPEAATRLQALTLGLAERVCSLERRLTGGIGGGYPAASLGAPFPCLHSWLFSQLQRRPLPAPGRVLGWWGLSNSYQVRTVTVTGWGCAHSSVTQFPQNKTQAPEIGSYVERRVWTWDPPGFRCSPILFPPDPDPQRGVPGPGVRRRCPGESLINPGFKRCLPTAPPPVPRVQPWTLSLPPHLHNVSPLLFQ